jgi:NAD(P)-dependent dehydrogenase (short-subunit alcohol dehydrogenase family)
VLAGKVAIVSGVGTGLGRSIALALARQGAGVALAARTESTLESIASEVKQTGGEAWWQRFDISDPNAAPFFVEGVNERFGRIEMS